MKASSPGVLWLVATPIGHLDDITLRALNTLRDADLVLAEDTRHTSILTRHHGIETPLAAFHAHSSEARREALARQIAQGKRVALVSDAGTPGISDPGAELATSVRAQGGRVEVLPGASAVLTALLSSGLRADGFRFVGFLPRSGGRRQRALAAIARDPLTSVVFESPRRTRATLTELSSYCEAHRPVAVCRELTKHYEEVVRGSVAEIATKLSDREPRGEVCLVIAGHDGAPLPDPDGENASPSEADLESLIRDRLSKGQPAKAVARELAREHGLDRRALYRQIVAIKTTQ